MPADARQVVRRGDVDDCAYACLDGLGVERGDPDPHANRRETADVGSP